MKCIISHSFSLPHGLMSWDSFSLWSISFHFWGRPGNNILSGTALKFLLSKSVCSQFSRTRHILNFVRCLGAWASALSVSTTCLWCETQECLFRLSFLWALCPLKLAFLPLTLSDYLVSLCMQVACPVIPGRPPVSSVPTSWSCHVLSRKAEPRARGFLPHPPGRATQYCQSAWSWHWHWGVWAFSAAL